jgi:hypothetical protein
MNPDAYKQPEAKPKKWACPCNGCAKAVKQERARILEAIESIDINSSSQLNALGMKMIFTEIVNEKSAAAREKKNA